METIARLTAIVDSSDDAIISTDLEGLVTTWNTAASTLFGFRADEFLGQSIFLVIPPEIFEEEVANLQKVRSGVTVEPYESQRLKKGGERLNLSIKLSPLKDSQGSVIGVSVIARDITSQKQFENARWRLAAIVESSDDAIVGKDLNGIITSWNASAEKIFGFKADDMIGRSIMTLIPPELQHEEVEIMRRLKAGERIEHFETQRLKRGGDRINVSLTISPIKDARGRVIGASKIARDISERRRTDETRLQLAAIVESSEDAIIGKTLEGVITSWNDAARRLFGYEPEEIIGHSVLRLIPRELHREEPMILARLRAGNRVEHYESKRVKKNGEVFDVSLTISPIKDSYGRVIGASKIVRDITERKRTEAALIEKEKLAATGQLAATLAHEVNNPLESILNLAYLLTQDDSLPEQAHNFAQMLLQEALRAGEITKRTLSFYRARMAPKEVQLPALLEGVLTAKRKKISEKAVQVSLEVKGHGTVWGIGGELMQVFSNLIENAIDAVSAHGNIRIRVRDLNTNGGNVSVSICDDGVGMSRATVGRLFQPFFTTKPDKGSGVGLWVTSGIVQKHGGSVRLRTTQSQRNHGTVFRVILPTRAEHAALNLKDIMAAD